MDVFLLGHRDSASAPGLNTSPEATFSGNEIRLDSSDGTVLLRISRTTNMASTDSNPPNNLHAVVACSAFEPSKCKVAVGDMSRPVAKGNKSTSRCSSALNSVYHIHALRVGARLPKCPVLVADFSFTYAVE